MSEPPDRRRTAAPSALITGIAPLSTFPISMGDFRELTLRLRPHEKASLEVLFFYVYQHGASIQIDDLATIAGVGSGRWIAMASQLAPFFHLTDEAWDHPGLREAHEAYFRQNLDRVGRRRPIALVTARPRRRSDACNERNVVAQRVRRSNRNPAFELRRGDR